MKFYFKWIPAFLLIFFAHFIGKRGSSLLATPKFSKFLSIEDLEDLNHFRWEMEPLHRLDEAYINTLFEDWDKPQEISNLLQFPDLIPEKLRFKFIHRGLTDTNEPYYNLSAISGIHSPEVLNFTNRQNRKLKKLLFAHIGRNDDVRAIAATQILFSFISKTDSEEILRRMIHPNPIVKHNLFSMLVSFYGIEGVGTFLIKKQHKYGEAAFNGKTLYCQFFEKIEAAETDEERKFIQVEMMLPKMTAFPNLKDGKIV